MYLFRKTYRTIFILCFLFFFTQTSGAGVWEYYLSSNTVNDFALSEDYLWALTPAGVFRWNFDGTQTDIVSVTGGMFSRDVNLIAANGGKVIAAANGKLLKYDGTSFVEHELNSSHPEFTGITGIEIDSSGIEWFIIPDGVARYDGDSLTTYPNETEFPYLSSTTITTGEHGIAWKVSHYTFGYKPAIQPMGFSNAVNKIAGDPPYGAIISMFNGESWERIKTLDPIGGGYTIRPAAGPGNKLYMFDSTIYDEDNGRILTYDGSEWGTIALENFPHSVVYSMDIDIETNRAIFGFANYLEATGVSVYDLSTNPAREIEQGLAGYSARKCRFGPDNIIWAKTDDSLFRHENGIWNQIRTSSFAGNRITSYIEDSGGAVWFATTTGLSRIKNGTVDSYYGDDYGLSDHILNVTTDNYGHIWIVASDGIAKFNDGNWNSYPMPDGENTGFIHFDDAGDIWLNRKNGIYVFDGITLNWLFNGVVHNLAVDTDGRLWIIQYYNTNSGYNKLFRFEGHEPVLVPGDDMRFLNVAIGPNGDVWMLDGSYFKAHRYRDGVWTTYTQEDGVPFDTNRIYFHSGETWISSPNGGVAKLEGNEWHVYSKSDGVVKGLEGMLFCDDGSAWAWGDDGVSRYNGETWEFVRDAFGLTYNDTFNGVRAPDGSIWFVTRNGLMQWYEGEWISTLYPDIGISSGYFFDSSNTLWYIAPFQGVVSYSGNPVFVQDTVLRQDSLLTVQAYPNPFNPTTTIAFTLPETEHVVLTVYSITGQEIETLVDEKLNRGSHTVNFNANGLPSGVYFYRIIAGPNVTTEKVLLLR